jgi:RNA polymerase sigma factor (sigma-70 family)
MAKRPMNGFLRQLRRAAYRHDDGAVTDEQLLDGFLRAREPAAFEELVRRHGPMVLGVCQRVLANAHDAEDAFQATFLVLVRRASSIVARETLGNWLYGVAYRTAQKARAAAALRRAKEKQMAKPEAIEEDTWRELRPLLDQELNRLPDKYREPVVLCDLEGQTRKAAARRLGCPEGTLSVRLSRARVMLAKRLTRHGLVLSGGAVAVALSHNAASACVPPALLSSTVQAATLVAAGHAAAGVVSAPVAALTEGVLQAMFRTKVKILAAVALAVGLIGVGIGVYQAGAAPPGASGGSTVAAAAPAPGEKQADDAKDDEKINLPKGQPPTQVLVSLDKDGKLVVKHAVTGLKGIPVPLPAPGAPGAPGGALPPLPANRLPPPPAGAGGDGGKAPPGAGGVVEPPPAAPGPGGGAAPAATGAPRAVGLFGAAGGANTGGGDPPPAPQAPGDGPPQAAPPPAGPGGGFPGRPGGGVAPGNLVQVTTVQSQTYDPGDVEIIDTKGKKVDKKELPKLLKEETVAMASLYGQPVDPLHLRVLKDGILTFVLPQPKGVAPGLPGVAPPGFPGGRGGALLPPAHIVPPAPGGVPAGPGGGGGPPRFGPGTTPPAPPQPNPPAPPGASGGSSEGP